MPVPGVAALSVAWVLADNGDDGGGEAKKAGPIALVVILVLAIACYFLFRSMTRHLRKVREDFPGDEPPTGPDDEPPASNRPASNGSSNGADNGSSNGADNGSSSAPPGREPSSP